MRKTISRPVLISDLFCSQQLLQRRFHQYHKMIWDLIIRKFNAKLIGALYHQDNITCTVQFSYLVKIKSKLKSPVSRLWLDYKGKWESNLSSKTSFEDWCWAFSRSRNVWWGKKWKMLCLCAHLFSSLSHPAPLEESGHSAQKSSFQIMGPLLDAVAVRR